MNQTPLVRADALTHREDFERAIEAESDPRRCAFLKFVYSQALISMSAVDAEVALDMRGVAALAARMFEREKVILDIILGKNLNDDW